MPYDEPMWVKSLWRYPVKSMQGECLQEIVLTPYGVAGDRRYGVFDRQSGTILSAKREAQLLSARACYHGEVLMITIPEGTAQPIGPDLDTQLSAWLDRDVCLLEASFAQIATFQAPSDFTDDTSDLVQWSGTAGSFVDESTLHILSTEILEALNLERRDLSFDVSRFRPNIEVAGNPEELDGEQLYLGTAHVVIDKPCSRCVMVTRPQAGIARELDILRHLISTRDANLGVRAHLARGGIIRVGDGVTSLIHAT